MASAQIDKIVTKTNMSRHRRTISCATYVKPPAEGEAPPAVVEAPPVVVVASTAYDDEYWSDGGSSSSSYGWKQCADP